MHDTLQLPPLPLGICSTQHSNLWVAFQQPACACLTRGGQAPGEEMLTFVGDVLRLSNAQSAKATEGKFSNLAANLITDLVSVVRVLEHNLQHSSSLG